VTVSPAPTVASGLASPTPSPSQAEAAPTPQTSPTARPTEPPFVITWTEAARIDSEGILYADSVRLRAFNGRFIALVGQDSLWASDDGLKWKPVLVVTDISGSPDAIVDFAVNGQRAVALGWNTESDTGAIWTSDNGLDWERGQDPPVLLATIGATSGGFVALGAGAVWKSSDGSTWQRATDDTSRHIAQQGGRLFTVKGETVAYVRGGTRAVEVWQTQGAGWSKLGVLPDSKDVSIDHATVGPRGWVAFGWSGFWVSETGTDWRKADPSEVPQHATVESVVGLEPGFVAVGYSGDQPGVTCGSGEPLVAHTWTSRDGLKWAEMKQNLPDVRFTALYARNQTLYVLGGKGQTEESAVWTAPLPDVARAAKGVEAIRDPGTGGCGP
jgi:hypothetical protein